MKISDACFFYRRFRPSTYVESIQISRFSPDFWRSKQAFCALGLTNFAELFSYNIPCRTERWEETVTYRVYADVILLQNLAADFLLLSVVKNCLRLPERRYGRLAGSLLGAVYALGMVLAPVPLGYAGRMLLSATMSVLMVWTAFSIRRKSEAAEAAIGLYAGGWLHGTGSAAWNTGESSVLAVYRGGQFSDSICGVAVWYAAVYEAGIPVRGNAF